MRKPKKRKQNKITVLSYLRNIQISNSGEQTLHFYTSCFLLTGLGMIAYIRIFTDNVNQRIRSHEFEWAFGGE